MSAEFRTATRDELRTIFQPSKVLLAVVPTPIPDRCNVLPLCFHTWCSYSPLLYCVAIQRSSYSAELFEVARDFTLGIPGEKMLGQVVFCGTHTGRTCDKARQCGIEWIASTSVSTPGIRTAIANMEVQTQDRLHAGDHLLVIGNVVSISISDIVDERPLLAVGPNSKECEVLWQHSIHSVGVIPK